MRLMTLLAVTGITILTACSKDDIVDSGDPVDSGDSSPTDLPPLLAQVILSGSWADPYVYNGYTVAGSTGGLLTTMPGAEVVVRLPWSVGQGVIIESVAEIVTDWPGGSDAIRTWSDGSVNLAFGVMGGGMATYYPAGVDGLIGAAAEDAPITITGTVDEGYTGRVFRDDYDGDGLEDLAVVEGSVPGNVRIFSDLANLSGDYLASDADITIEACGESRAYGPTFIEIFGDDLVGVGCASRDFHSGLVYIFAMPISSWQEPIDIVEDNAGWYSASRGLGHPAYLDRRGRGEIVAISADGEDDVALAPDDAGSRFGASPVLAEHDGRWYLVVGDQSWGDPRETTTVGRVTVCDVTNEPIPEGDWFTDCIHLNTPDDIGLEYIGAGVDIDSFDIDDDGISELVVTATGWQFGGTSAPGVVAWIIFR